MPKYLLREGLAPELAQTLYRRLASVHNNYALEDPVRQAVIRAATTTLQPLHLASLLVAVAAVAFGVLMPNYKLGKTHNLVCKAALRCVVNLDSTLTNVIKIEGTDVAGRKIVDVEKEKAAGSLSNETTWQRIRREFL